MNRISITSSAVLLFALVGYFAIIPASVTVHVGDNSARMNEIGGYGYIKIRFSVRSDDPEVRLSWFWIGPRYYLMIGHNDTIDSLTHFRTVPVPGTYSEWESIQDVDSFTVDRPSPKLFFIWTAVLGIAGYGLRKFPNTAMSLYVLLVLFATGFVLRYSTLAGTFATLPALIAVGWLAAPALGYSISGRWWWWPRPRFGRLGLQED